MRLKSLFDRVKLLEMPIRNIERRGDFSKTGHEKGSINKRTDIKLLRHPKTEAILRKAFQKFPQTFDVYMINDTDHENDYKDVLRTARYNPEHLNKSYKHLQGIAATQKFGIESAPNVINIIVTSNGLMDRYSENLGPMSAWMMVHRIWQSVFDDTPSMFNKNEMSFVVSPLDPIVGDREMGGDNADWLKKALSCFTFRSAREKTVTRRDDLVFEIMTQYCITGGVKFTEPEKVWEFLNDTPFDERDRHARKWRKLYINQCTMVEKRAIAMINTIFKRTTGGCIVVT